MILPSLIIMPISHLVDALLRIPGVGDINARADNFSMRIWLNPDKMASYSLTPQDVISALNEQNVQVAAGSVGAPPQEATHRPTNIVFLLTVRLNKVSEFEKIIVKIYTRNRRNGLYQRYRQGGIGQVHIL
jgi:multidrug efflux pump subunit AcrB